MKKNNMLKDIFSIFMYKEKQNIKDFYVPEVNESDDPDVDNHADESSCNVVKNETNTAEGQKNCKASINTEEGTEQTGNKASNEENKKAQDSKDEKTESLRNLSEKRNIKIKKPITLSEFNNKKKNTKENKSDKKPGEDNTDVCKMSSDYKENMEIIRSKFNYPSNKDIVFREFLVGEKKKAFLVYMEGMVDRITVNNFIMAPIFKQSDKFKKITDTCELEFLLKNVLEAHQVKEVYDLSDVIDEILVGDTGIYIEGCDYLLFCETKGFEKRSVSTPQVEAVVRGSQEAFNENIRTNITLLRRIIKSRHLTTEFMTVGARNKMNVAITYLEGVINPAIVKEVKRRLKGVKTDFIGSSGMLEQFIEDNPYSIIPTVLITERPDRTASHILEGKLAISVEGAPFAIVVPVSINTLFHSPEDTTLRWQYGTLVRFVRVFAIFIATLLPGLYVALTSFHKEMIPTDLLIAIAKAKENVPFPTIVEVILMELSFELIREAGVRIPGIVGNTIGIIGALILGQAAVQANLVSPVMIIIVAFTGLGNFAITDYSLAFGVRILRVLFIFTGGILGFYGISLSLVALGYYMVNLKSFGVPFFSTLTPKTRTSHDLLLRRPIWKQELRPDNVNPVDIRRQPHISRTWTRMKHDKEDTND